MIFSNFMNSLLTNYFVKYYENETIDDKEF